jgi:hypothetical protein
MAFAAATSPLSRRAARLREWLTPGATTDVVGVMARREAQRFLFPSRSRQTAVVALLAASGGALLIPLHRLYGGSHGRSDLPYFLVYALAVQIALVLIFSRAVWASLRQDAATGSADELLVTGASLSQVVVGKWLGLAAAGAVWTAMLLPSLLLASAFARAQAGTIGPVLAAWALSAAAGAMLGTLLAISERGSAAGAAWFGMLVQAWFVLRWIFPMMASRIGLAPWALEVVRAVAQADPVSLIPAAVGALREPWLPKASVLFFLVALGLLRLTAWEAEGGVPWQAAKAKPVPDFLSLRPVRAWMTGSRTASPEYDGEVVYPFERAFGWRMRVSAPMWLCILAVGCLPAVPLAILGREGNAGIAVLVVFQAAVASGIGALGAAGALAAEREQGRWPFLLCAPLRAGEIVLAKWRTAWIESRPLWLGAAGVALLGAVAGALPWTAVLPAASAAPVLSAGSAAWGTLLCVQAPSLTAAQQRALLWLLTPTALALGSAWLLPGLPGVRWISPAMILWSALSFHPGFAAPAGTLVALGAFAASGALALLGAIGVLRRWPPV